jgi:endonuclease YncB( thermonuclease family)
MRLVWLAVLVAALLAAGAARAAPSAFAGDVTRVRDGDTIEVEGVAVRLQGVAAPERRDPLGRLAAEAMRDFVLGQRVVCHPDGTRSRDRIVAVCELAGVDLGAYLVRLGLARDCPRFSGGRYRPLEAALGDDAPILRLYTLPSYCRPRGRELAARR